eukprot:TRINITY_DN16965_c2_g1_i1.p1 TRINITY_DN16965_c2_g1~~TRINITY_DN16965_c2_g1_i1.p1  ORF type:complete len:151 (+),score=7.73 TRINITY_DN16965_c2_g1_i1:53-454(+)
MPLAFARFAVALNVAINLAAGVKFHHDLPLAKSTSTRQANDCGTGYQLDHYGWWSPSHRDAAGDDSVGDCAGRCSQDHTCIAFHFFFVTSESGQCFKYDNEDSFLTTGTYSGSIACKKQTTTTAVPLSIAIKS